MRLILSFALTSMLYAGPAADLRKAFQSPPDDSRIMMRWWWFGPGVTKAELEKEMRLMKQGGIGGFEVQPVYPLELDNDKTGFKNLTYLSPEFLDAVRFTSEKARELGLRMDMTLCSGWPYGGPHITGSTASRNIRVERIAVQAGQTSFAMPNMIESEQLVAAFLAKGSPMTAQGEAPAEGRGRRGPAMHYDGTAALRITRSPLDGRAQLPKDLAGANTVLVFVSSLTGQQVKRPSVGSEGFVLDHYSRAAIDQHLKTVGDKLMLAFNGKPPYSVFSDSLEVYSADWTPNFLDEFRKRRGYDLMPYLPALAGDIGDKTLSVRHDWGRTLTELVEENYLTPVNEWAKRNHTQFRSQTYGYPPVRMSSNALVALPEGEGPQWRGFSSTRWATSASHLYGRPVTSSETWTWLHSPVFRATPLDMKAEADLHFLQGVNQLVGHGWPYSPDSAGEPGWRFYAAAVFNHHNPWWWVAMPDISKYLQRTSFALRQGKPANDVAIYLPTDDAWAHMTPGQATINVWVQRTMNAQLIPQILDAGFNFDFIDDSAVAVGGIPFKAIILPDVERIPLETYLKIIEFGSKGGKVFALGHAPLLAPGLNDAPLSSRVQDLSAGFFERSGSIGHLVKDAGTLGSELAKAVQPDFAAASEGSSLGIVHRATSAGDLYFVVNTSNQAIHTTAVVRSAKADPQWWDPMSGEVFRASASKAANGTSVQVDLAPYESRFLFFGAEAVANAPALPGEPSGQTLDISTGWKVSFAGQPAVDVGKLHSWADDASTKYFSGQATYAKSIEVPQGMLQGHSLALDFGPGTVVPDPHRTGPGVRALLESPVREAAAITVNGQTAGTVWAPPYRIEVTKLLHTGTNEIKIVVGNLALNNLAGQALPNYKLLTARYTERFQAQDMDQVQALPAGITGAVKLVTR